MVREKAETVGIQALGWLAGQEDLMNRFLAASGMDINNLKQNAADPEILGAVLDFVLSEDASVRDFCDAFNLGYTQPMEARQSLPGGAIVNWT